MMKSVATAIVLACVAPAIMAQQLMVNSLNDVVTCQPAMITWQGGQAPYYVSLIPAGQPSAAPLKQFPTQNGNSFTWNVDMQPGTAFTTALKDSSGTIVYSGEQTILGGSDTSCVNNSVSESVSATGTSTAGSSAASTAGPTSSGSQGAAFAAPSSTTSSASHSASVNATASHTTTSATTTSTQGSQNSATRGYAALGLVGITGLVGFVGLAIL